MADLVIGIAKSVVDGAVTKAQAAIDKEEKQWQSAQRNLVFITGELQMMQSFLRVADGKRLENGVVMTWVRQIRDLAYDVEDCIELVVHLDKKKRWWVRFLEPGRCIMPCLPPPWLDEAVAELERLKARVEDVSSRNARYSLIVIGDGDSGCKPAAAEDQPPASSDSALGVGVAAAFDRFLDAAGTKKGELTDLIHKEQPSAGGGDRQVIAVWGSTGSDLGVTSVIWSAYNDKGTREGFSCRAWIKLRRPFNPHEFVRSLASQFFSSTRQEQGGGIVALDVLKKMKASQGELQAKLAQYVSQERFLVVLEDLASMEEWNAIAKFFPKKGGKGSCIIVSTLNFEVASLSVGDSYRVLHLNQLSAQHSVYGFYEMETQRDGDASSPSKKVAAAKSWKDDHPLLVGRESETKDIDRRVDQAAQQYQVLSVWGIAGVGKSSLVKHMFCDKIIKKKRFKKYAWVDLSHPFNISDFSRSLLLSFDSEALQTQMNAEHRTMGGKNPVLECREMLQNESKRCLIVIDGVQSATEWDTINAELLQESNNVKMLTVVVIASEASIATHCRGPEGPYTYNVKGLGPVAAFELFAKEFKKTVPPNAVSDVRELVSKCGGLPKVIVEISRLLQRIGWTDRARSINNKFIEELKNKREFGGLQDLFYWMQLYFRNCPDSLKPCILYLSIFSPNRDIRRRRLVRRWIAEGYSGDSHEESAEKKGEKQFLDLLSLSILQEPSSVGLDDPRKRIVSCQVNGFFRQYIVYQRMEENLVFELDGNCAVTTQRTGRHLCISQGWDRDKVVFDNIDFSRLRSLTVSGVWKSFFISESMRLLRVLDLEDASGVRYSDLEKISMWCPRIKFLSLRGQTEIYHLPGTIGDLRQLQTLDVRRTSIKTLPASITKLQKLQYVRAGDISPQHLPLSCWFSDDCRSRHGVGVKMPPGIQKLTVLHTLGVVDIGASGTKVILELKKITQLCKLGVSGVNKSNSKIFFSAISDLVHLESLSLWLDKNSEGCLDGISLPPPKMQSLRSLKLHGLEDKLPEWKELFTKLTKIDLEMTIVRETAPSKEREYINIEKEGVMRFLGKLPQLYILRIRAKDFENDELNVKVSSNGVEISSFENVKIFEIVCGSSKKAAINFGEEAMKNLEQLKVDCSISKFDGLDHLCKLKEVCVRGSIDEDLQNQLNNLKNRLVLRSA